jgi:hypothetical protein
MTKTRNTMLAAMLLSGFAAVVSCSEAQDTAQQAADKRVQAEADCARLARDKTGYNPASPASTSSNIGKGAAIGAAGGAVIGAATAKKNTSKKAVQGAAIGAAAGAGVGALQDNEKKKQAAQTREAYQREYETCLREKGGGQ